MLYWEAVTRAAVPPVVVEAAAVAEMAAEDSSVACLCCNIAVIHVRMRYRKGE